MERMRYSFFKERGDRMFQKFMKEEKGSVIQWIILLAVIALLVVGTSSKTKFYTKYWSDSSHENTDEGLTGDGDPSTPTTSGDSTIKPYVAGGVDGILKSPTLTTNPGAPFYFNYTNYLSFKAEANEGVAYDPIGPFTCEWKGYIGYSGNSCNPNIKSTYGLGSHDISVRICDARGACNKTNRTFEVITEPLASQIQRDWENYVKTGFGTGEGDWKYETSQQRIYSTQNVGWTGFWNPANTNLENYELEFDMGVSPTNDDDALGMTFRMQDLNTMYILSIDRYYDVGNGVAGFHSGVYKRVGSTQTRIADLKSISWEPNKYAHYKIRVEDNEITIWKDGSKIVDYTDKTNPILKGAWGPFSISQANANFKNLSFQTIK